LRWDSLGEFLALAVSLEHLSEVTNNPKALILADALDLATEKLLDNRKGPSRKVGEIDNRGSHFYLAMYWAEALAEQTKDADLQKTFVPIAKQLVENEGLIMQELNKVQGHPVNLGGYYELDEKETSQVMRPSKTFNNILKTII
jgi:isocitrate dehydrogenase